MDPAPVPLADAPLGLAWLDAIGLGLIALLALLGALRGLWWQVFRLVGVGVAVLVARALAPRLAPLLQAGFAELEPRVTSGIAWLLVFVAALGSAALLGHLRRKALEVMQLDLVDRVGGGLAGALTGLLVHAVLIAALALLASDAWLQGNVAPTRSAVLLSALSERWPILTDRATGARIGEVLAGERPPAPEAAPAGPPSPAPAAGPASAPGDP